MVALGPEYTSFLQDLGVIGDLTEFLLRENRRYIDDLDQLSGCSCTHLELSLENLRTIVMSQDLK